LEVVGRGRPFFRLAGGPAPSGTRTGWRCPGITTGMVRAVRYYYFKFATKMRPTRCGLRIPCGSGRIATGCTDSYPQPRRQRAVGRQAFPGGPIA